MLTRAFPFLQCWRFLCSCDCRGERAKAYQHRTPAFKDLLSTKVDIEVGSPRKPIQRGSIEHRLWRLALRRVHQQYKWGILALLGLGLTVSEECV